ncbi:NAD(P)-dependent oxidoreductase [Henriciella aquimarina]|uniref:NAD(P)-dependent oxidoreductase n=1 Tax=Henriciella aquimarina TaxID=545261 RepID=UPI0009FD03DE|nr:NAD(P)-dependent oxidoreductase [Henriciella aquimarina]
MAEKRQTVGYIGLGDIGAPMAERIARSGWSLSVWNRTPEKMKPLIEAGATAVQSPAELATACDLVFICLSSVAASYDVMFGSRGLLEAAPRRVSLIVDNSTIPPSEAEVIEAKLAKHSIRYLEAPVSGGAIGARAGTLAAMVGGQKADLDEARPILECYASKITHLGPVGAGQAMKACNQVINFGTIAALAEATTLGSRYGLTPFAITEAIAGGFADSNISREFGRSLAAADPSPVRTLTEALRDFYNADIRKDLAGQLDILLKDLSMALDMGRQSGVPLPVTTHIDWIYRMLHHLED